MATILTKEEAQALCKKILSFSKAETCEVNILGEERGNIRYARNTVSTSGSLLNKNIAVQSSFGKKVGISTIDEFDDSSLEKVVRRSEELAQLSPESPEFVPPLSAQEYLVTNGFSEVTANANPATRAEAVAQSLELARAQNLTAAGYLENRKIYTALMNSNGLFAYYPSTNVDFSLTVRTADATGSGYVSRGYNDLSKLDTAAASRIAIQKAKASVNAKAIEPGKYTVILEPAAVAVLLENLFFNLDARSADEGRSFLSKPGGKTKLGQKLVDDRITIYSDPQFAELPTSPWATDGRRQEKINWIEKGVIKNFTYSRYWAEKQKVKAVPPPNGFIMPGGTASLEDLIKGTDKGILVTRLWYIRTVDPQTLLLTGLTRDGTFYIENGKITFPVKNFRFNESPVIMLNNLEAIGKSERTVSGESSLNYILPPLKIRDFTFTSLSDAV